MLRQILHSLMPYILLSVMYFLLGNRQIAKN